MEESNPRGFEFLPNYALKKRYIFTPIKFGEGGIRTLGGVSPTTTFEVVTLNRSDTSPLIYIVIQKVILFLLKYHFVTFSYFLRYRSQNIFSITALFRSVLPEPNCYHPNIFLYHLFCQSFLPQTLLLI